MSKEAMMMMKKAMAMLEKSMGPMDMEEKKHEMGELAQEKMDMGGESPNDPNLSEDAENKDQGGFEQKKRAFVAMMRKGK